MDVVQAILANRSAASAAGDAPSTSDEQHALSIARKVCNGLSANLTVPCTVAAQQVSQRGGPTLSHSVAFFDPRHYAAALRSRCSPAVSATADAPDTLCDFAAAGDGGAMVFPKTLDYLLRRPKLCTVSYLYKADPLLPPNGRAPVDCDRTDPSACAPAFIGPCPAVGALDHPLVEFSPYVVWGSFRKATVSRSGPSTMPFDRAHPQYETHCLVPFTRRVVPCFTASFPLWPADDAEPEAKKEFAAFVLGVFRDHDLVPRGVPLWPEFLRWKAPVTAMPLTSLGQYAAGCLRILAHIQDRGTAAAHSSAHAKCEAEEALLLRRTAAAEAGEVYDADPDALDVEAAWPGEDNRRNKRATGTAYEDSPDDLLANFMEDDDHPRTLEESRAAAYARDALGDLADVGLGDATGNAKPPPQALVSGSKAMRSLLRDMTSELSGKAAVQQQPSKAETAGPKQYELRPTREGGLQTGYYILGGQPQPSNAASPSEPGPFVPDAKPAFERLTSPPSIADTIILFTLSDDQALAFAYWAEYLTAKVCES